MSHIKLSPTHGVNPSVLVCFICGKDWGVALLGRLPGDVEAPRQLIAPREYCNDCTERLKTKIALIRVAKGSDESNPHRLGEVIFVAEEEVLPHLTPDAVREQIARQRVTYMDDETWQRMGLPVVAESDRAAYATPKPWHREEDESK